jgi:hypothetical protein
MHLKQGAISQQDHDRATTELVKIAQEKIQNLFNDNIASVEKQIKDLKLAKPKPIDIDVQPHVNFLDPDDIDILTDRIKKRTDEREQAAALAASRELNTGTNRQRFDKITASLEQERQTILNSTTITEELKKQLVLQKDDELAKARRDFFEAEIQNIQTVLNFAAQAVDVWQKFNDAKAAKENAALNKELKANDLKKNSYKKELDGKLLSQAQYDKKVAELDADSDKKKEDLAKKQFERNKKSQLAGAIISGAQAIASGFATQPFIPAGLIAGALATTLTVAQIQTIRNTQYDSAATYETGGKLEGPSHKDGGIKLRDKNTGQYFAEAEGGEGMINKGVMKDKNTYSFRGTPSQIASAINGLNGGNTWEQGATVVQMPAWRTQKPAQINPNMPRIMEQGGIVRPINGSTQQSAAHTESNAVLVEMKQELSGMREDMQNWKTQLHAVVSIKEYRDQERKYDAAKKASGIAQK